MLKNSAAQWLRLSLPAQWLLKRLSPRDAPSQGSRALRNPFIQSFGKKAVKGVLDDE